MHFEPSFLELNGILRRGEHYPPVHPHVITRMLNPHFLSQTASYDVASTIHESLLSGLCDADWDAAHELVKRIVMHVVLASDRPLVRGLLRPTTRPTLTLLLLLLLLLLRVFV